MSTLAPPGESLAHAELLDTLRSLCVRLPVPGARWHPHVASIAAVRNDFEDALAQAAASRDALRLLDLLVAGSAEAGFDRTRSPQLTAAWDRLEALPVPEGRHPYLDEILPALDAHRLLLVALSRAAR